MSQLKRFFLEVYVSLVRANSWDVSARTLAFALPRGSRQGVFARARSRPDCGDVSGGFLVSQEVGILVAAFEAHFRRCPPRVHPWCLRSIRADLSKYFARSFLVPLILGRS